MKSKLNKQKNVRIKIEGNGGFSLIELIIVIAIMAVLTGALAPALIKYIRKSRESTYIDTAKKIQLAADTMIVDVGNDGYTVSRIVYSGDASDGSVGSGYIYCKNSDGSVSDISDSTAKQQYLEDMIDVMNLGSMRLNSSNGTPVQLVYDSSGALVDKDSSNNESTIILSNKSGKKKAKLSYASGEWQVIESY
jgi:prepilin-type N-terminal cleavage/methylation domain-containing protein